MKLTLKRLFLGTEYTIGKLYMDGVYFSDTLEDPVIDIDKSGKFDNGEVKVYGESAIPYGIFEITLNVSPRFKRLLPRLIDVPHFSGILIHRGNYAKDTHGCILVGENKTKGAVLNSAKYEIELVAKIKAALDREEEITIEIV